MNHRRRLERELGTVLGELKRIDSEATPDLPDRSMLLARMERLHDALDRLEDGVYGLCLHCGQTIQTGRLKSRPETETCVACDQRAASVRRRIA